MLELRVLLPPRGRPPSVQTRRPYQVKVLEVPRHSRHQEEEVQEKLRIGLGQEKKI